MAEVVLNGAWGFNMWFVTLAFTGSDLLRPKYRQSRSEGGSGVSRRLGTLDMASTVLIQFALWAVVNDKLQ